MVSDSGRSVSRWVWARTTFWPLLSSSILDWTYGITSAGPVMICILPHLPVTSSTAPWLVDRRSDTSPPIIAAGIRSSRIKNPISSSRSICDPRIAVMTPRTSLSMTGSPCLPTAWKKIGPRAGKATAAPARTRIKCPAAPSFASRPGKERLMSQAEPVIRNISDTANWAAIFRARETARPDALFRDPFARRLAGERGEQIFATLPARDRNEWAWVTRTFLFDQFITDQVGQGVDMVVNLAAGLDARPYRMPLPASLKWIEVDLQDILAYKEELLRGERPVCALERIRLDLANVDARRALFERLGRGARR